MKILFVICGEGLGHASRSSRLARYLKGFGHECHLASYGKAYEFIKNQGEFQVTETFREVELDGENGYFSLSKTLWSSKSVPIALARSLKHVRNLIIDNSIDLVISDTMYAALTAARIEKVHSLFITNQNRFATASDNNSTYWSMLGRIIEKYLEIPDSVIVPDFAPPHTISGYNLEIEEEDKERYKFVGPLMDIRLSDYSFSNGTIFASFGGEPFKIPMYGILKEIAEERPFQTFEVFSTSNGLPEESDNFKTFGYVSDIYEHLSKARIAIVHGGLTTLHEALLFRKPCVMIIDPYHPEQWNNARKIEEIGAGIIIEGNKLTKERLNEVIDRALAMTHPDYSSLFAEQDGKHNIHTIIKNMEKSV
jgi:uncharacterized protein (TIGR00661 family)